MMPDHTRYGDALPDYGPPVDASGRVPGIDHAPQPPPPLDGPPVDTVRIELDAHGSGAYPSLYLVEVAHGDVITYVLSADTLPPFERMTWRTRAMLRGYLARIADALDRVE